MKMQFVTGLKRHNSEGQFQQNETTIRNGGKRNPDERQRDTHVNIPCNSDKRHDPDESRSRREVGTQGRLECSLLTEPEKPRLDVEPEMRNFRSTGEC
jgi:hypothetical protein